MAQKTSDEKDSKQTTQKAANMSSVGDTETAEEAEDEMDAPVKNADYWFDKGALCATYGNDPAAIKYFQKVINSTPNEAAPTLHRAYPTASWESSLKPSR